MCKCNYTSVNYFLNRIFCAFPIDSAYILSIRFCIGISGRCRSKVMHTHLHVEYVYICFIQTLSKIATKGVSSTDMYVNAPTTSDPGKDIQVWKFVTLSLGYFHMSFRKNILNPMK